MRLAFKALERPPKLRRLPQWVLRSVAQVTSLVNPTVADLMRAITIMSSEGASAPNYGHRHLEDFFNTLAREAVKSR